MKPLNSELTHAEVERILVLQSGNVSTIVMLSPALRALRHAFPRAEITLMTSPASRQIAPLLPWIDRVMVDQTVAQDGTGRRSVNPREEISVIEQLRRFNFSLALIFSDAGQSPTRAAFACYLAGIPYRVGYARGMSASILSHPLPPPAEDLHEVDRNLQLLESIGFPVTGSQTELIVSDNVERRANELLDLAGLDRNVPYIVIAPEPGDARQHYPPEQLALAARILAAQAELQIVIVGTSAKAAAIQPLTRVAHENLYGNVCSLVEKTTLPELAAIIRQASLTITNHSVSMHFADAFQVPMVVLHAGSDPVDQGLPRNASARLLTRPALCSACNQVSCPNGSHCRDIRPEEIAIAALEMLTGRANGEADYKDLFRYKLESEMNDQSTAR